MLGFSPIASQPVGSQSSQQAVEPPKNTDIDATKIPASRTVVFEGSTRTVAFDGSVRTIAFEGSKRTVKF